MQVSFSLALSIGCSTLLGAVFLGTNFGEGGDRRGGDGHFSWEVLFQGTVLLKAILRGEGNNFFGGNFHVPLEGIPAHVFRRNSNTGVFLCNMLNFIVL